MAAPTLDKPRRRERPLAKSFQNSFEELARGVLDALAPGLAPTVQLVGVPHPGQRGQARVWVEPDHVAFHPDLLAGLHAEVADPPRTDQDPFAQRRVAAIQQAVQARLGALDADRGTRSFCGEATRLGGSHVVPILQVRAAPFDALPSLKRAGTAAGVSTARSLPEVTVGVLLRKAREYLLVPQLGNLFMDSIRHAEAEVLRDAGEQFMQTPAAAGGNPSGLLGLFHACDVLSSRRYERAEGRGRMVVARPDHPAVRRAVHFRRAVALAEPGGARKVLQMASEHLLVLCDSHLLYGLGTFRPSAYDREQEDVFFVDFRGHHRWDLVHGRQILMRATDGMPGLARDRLREGEFKTQLRRALPEVTARSADRLWRLVDAASHQPHGTMVVVHRHADREAVRLTMQATPVDPARLPTEVVLGVTAIDGAVLVDVRGDCHAIGAILDGDASPRASPVRGARYNSAVRYVEAAAGAAVAVVISEDGTVDVIAPPAPARHGRGTARSPGTTGARRPRAKAPPPPRV